MDNPISVIINNCSCDKVKLEADQGEIEKDGECKYIYRANTLGTVHFTISKIGSDKIKATYLYKVYSIPELSVNLGTYSGGLISREQFLKEHKLSCTIASESPICGVSTSIDSFSFIIIRDSNVLFKEINYLDIITTTEKEAIYKTHSGDKILIFNIIASVNQRKYYLKPVEFTINE